MIYYATVHWQNDHWIDVQLAMLRKYTDIPFKIFASLNGIDKSQHSRFDYVLHSEIKSHEKKLNLLAEAIGQEADDDDWIIFIDGDAFPLKPVHQTLASLVEKHQLVAVQRRENLGEQQPHPCFCVTTVGLWKTIAGTWAKGHQWINAMGYPDTDVGGELMGILERARINWQPLHRTNAVNRHPVFFGIYGDLVYHHGAGFRNGASRQGYYEAGLYKIYKRLDARILNNIVPKQCLTWMRNSLIHPEGRKKRRIYKELAPIDAEVFSMVQSDPESVRNFLRSPDQDNGS